MSDTPETAPDPYVLISGNGRSGSNRLLDMFDASPRTVCRSELNETPDSDFHTIGGDRVPGDLEDARLAALQAAIARAKTRRGARDRLGQTDKSYLTPLGRLALPMMEKTRLRRGVAAVGLMRRTGEWTLPAPCLRPAPLQEARLILKLNSAPTWAVALAERDPNCRILHNIRDPLSYLKSWYARFIHNNAGFRLFEAQFGEVPAILAQFGRDDAERLRPATLENLVEVEIWRWRALNETLYGLATRPGQYLRVTYDAVGADPLATAERIYDFVGLPMEQRAVARIRAQRNTLFRTPHATDLDLDLCTRLRDQVLQGSPLNALF
jgi:hypothetical protein